MRRLKVDRTIDVDTSRLFSDLDTAAAYLKEVKSKHPDKQLTLDEQWCGYEQNGFVFTYFEEETDEEYNFRVEQLRMVEANKAKEQARAKEREKDLKELRRLKGKLGI